MLDMSPGLAGGNVRRRRARRSLRRARWIEVSARAARACCAGVALLVALASPVAGAAIADERPPRPQGEGAGPCVASVLRPSPPPQREWIDGAHRASADLVAAGAHDCERTYRLESTAPLLDRGAGGVDSPRLVTERAGRPTVRTGSVLFDALFALAITEADECSVASIRDGAFNGGAPLACPAGGCFETGRKWTYVWTRDTAYSVALGLASLDPRRARNSLEFKLSERREGGGLAVVQDTGSGGSYPVSTDRVVWALGARELSKYLDGVERAAFRRLAAEALRNTVELDRLLVYDPTDGLYRGEQSFLDWREQTYPRWTRDSVVHLATSKALSTNVAHLEALRLAAELVEEGGDAATARRYRAWAEALASAVRARLFLPEYGLLATFTGPQLAPAPVARFDALGTALAVLAGVLDADAAARAVERYPLAGKGVPAVFPQEQETPIYHNRSAWPFVTAYWARAARATGNGAAFDFAVRSLVRGAALNLSNMENAELLSGLPFLEDGASSGPVVNSQRQLWSVAGYLSMVQDGLFGVEATDEGVRLRPFVTRALRRELFANADSLVLNDFTYRGRRVSVVLHLPPPSAGDGAYGVGAVLLDGQAVGDAFVGAERLSERSRFDVHLVDDAGIAANTSGNVTLVAPLDDYRRLYAPRPPVIAATALVGGLVELSLDAGGEARGDVTFDVFRDGRLVASGLDGRTERWVDPGSTGAAHQTYCYAVGTRFTSSGHRSHHSAPRCHWCDGCVQSVSAADTQAFAHVGGARVFNHGRWHVERWGDAGHRLEVRFTPPHTGHYLVQLVFGNGAGPVSTGITCGLKWLTVREGGAEGPLVGEGPLVMPHLGSWSTWGDGSAVRVLLQGGVGYTAVVGEGRGGANMSALRHFERYDGGGGAGGAFFRVNVAELKLLALDGF